MYTKRLSISLTKEQEDGLLALRKTDKYCRMSYSMLIRMLLNFGLQHEGYALGDSQTGTKLEGA